MHEQRLLSEAVAHIAGVGIPARAAHAVDSIEVDDYSTSATYVLTGYMLPTTQCCANLPRYTASSSTK